MEHTLLILSPTVAFVAASGACYGGGEIVEGKGGVADGGMTSSADARGDAATPEGRDGASDVAACDGATDPASDTIATIALANVGLGACSTNSAGGQYYSTSCTGNDGSPEYWCADFALWVWTQAGVDTDGLDAAAGSFYLYGQSHGTLHDSPGIGDVVVFNYMGDGIAEHVAIVTQVSSDATIQTVSGDWDGVGATEAAFSSTSRVVRNMPAYPDTLGTAPSVMGMTISGYVSPHPGTGCYSATRAQQMSDNACVQTSTDAWGQCDNGTWTDRDDDPTPCNGMYEL